MPVAKSAGDGPITVDEIRTKVLELSILETSPRIMTRLSEKAKHGLLLPAGRKTTADKQSSLKHDPLDLARARLEALGVQASEVARVDERAARLVTDGVDGAKNAPGADAQEALTDVWADGGAAWRT